MALSKANPLQVVINGKTYDYLAFYYPGHNTDWDNVCGVPYFGNFWVEPFEVQLMGPVKATFYTAEAAYQASKWWDDSTIRNTFESKKTGDAAFSYKRHELKGIPLKGEYGGYPSGEEAMFEILKHKFSDLHPELKAALGATGNAYLLEHGARLNDPQAQDRVWSDGNDGKGTNHLGICLMKVRDFYFPGQGDPLASEPSTVVIQTCNQALRAEMLQRGLSADNKDAAIQ